MTTPFQFKFKEAGIDPDVLNCKKGWKIKISRSIL